MTDSVFSRRWFRGALMCVTFAVVLPALAKSENPTETRPVDHIVALVNNDPITYSEFRRRLDMVQNQMQAQGTSAPSSELLYQQILEQLVVERVQLQRAQALGLRVETDSVIEAQRRLASQNGLSLDDFRRRLLSQGITPEAFAFGVREQLLLQRLRDREVDARVNISDGDIDEFIAQQQRLQPLSNLSLHLAQILLAGSADMDPEQLRALEARAESIVKQAREGQDFAKLAVTHSNASDAARGGSLDMRPVDRLPELFVTATARLPVGAVVGPLRSGAGLHVLKVLAREQVGLPDAVVTQTRARHILLRASPQQSEAKAVSQMQRWRDEILSGRVQFESLARQHSQDGSASAGGDLGWASPGQFVPEFEMAMDALKPGEISEPVVSRFGVHLVRVDERRQVPMSLPEQRAMVRNLLRQEKAQAVLGQWLSELRAQAFIEYRDVPRP